LFRRRHRHEIAPGSRSRCPKRAWSLPESELAASDGLAGSRACWGVDAVLVGPGLQDGMRREHSHAGCSSERRAPRSSWTRRDGRRPRRVPPKGAPPSHRTPVRWRISPASQEEVSADPERHARGGAVR
jgi:hypothetical protein